MPVSGMGEVLTLQVETVRNARGDYPPFRLCMLQRASLPGVEAWALPVGSPHVRGRAGNLAGTGGTDGTARIRCAI